VDVVKLLTDTERLFTNYITQSTFSMMTLERGCGRLPCWIVCTNVVSEHRCFLVFSVEILRAQSKP